MGGIGSIFYPDNPKRRSRAEQLKNDCEMAQIEYDSARKKIADTLEPLHGQLDEVLKALGCNTLAELDEKILGTATGQALEDWEKIRGAYDITDKVEGIIFAACGVIAAAGLAISVVMGVFSIGVGFVSGLGITAGLTAILGALGLIFDAIDGAIQREKLREAIDKLFLTRNQIRQVVDQTYAMQDVVPTIKKLYDAVITAGITDPEVIKDILIEQGSSITDNAWTFYRSAQSLHDMDKSRKSWMDEDPDWESLARFLDLSQSITHNGVITPAAKTIPDDAATTVDLDRFEITTAISTNLYKDANIKVVISPINGTASGNVPYFDKTVPLQMLRVVSEATALVQIQGSEFENVKNKFVIEHLSSQKSDEKTYTSAEVLLLNPDMITQCLLPSGEYGTDKQLGRFRVTYA